MGNMTNKAELFKAIDKCAAVRDTKHNKALEELRSLSSEIKDILDIANAAEAAGIGLGLLTANNCGPGCDRRFGLSKSKVRVGLDESPVYCALGGGGYIWDTVIDENGEPPTEKKPDIDPLFVEKFKERMAELYDKLVKRIEEAAESAERELAKLAA